MEEFDISVEKVYGLMMSGMITKEQYQRVVDALIEEFVRSKNEY